MKATRKKQLILEYPIKLTADFSSEQWKPEGSRMTKC